MQLLFSNQTMDNNFYDVLSFGQEQELIVLRHLQNKYPHWNFKRLGGIDEPDYECLLGGVELKSTRGWYHKPCIEVKTMTTQKPSMWMSEDVRILIVNHEEWLHYYDTQKLKEVMHEFEPFYKDVWQEGNYYKTMKFINIRDKSTLQSRHCDIDDDPLRWDCSRLKNSPYLFSERKKKR